MWYIDQVEIRDWIYYLWTLEPYSCSEIRSGNVVLIDALEFADLSPESGSVIRCRDADAPDLPPVL